MISLGNEVRDVVTGFTGITTAKIEYLNGCVQFCVKPEMGEDGKMPDGEYIDAAQLVTTGTVIAFNVDETAEPTGGVMPDTPPTRYSG